MMNKSFRGRVLLLGLATALVVGGAAAAQDASKARRPVAPEDYGAWETLGGSALSPDGRWIAYAIARSDGEGELRVRMLATEATEAFKHGSNPRFSRDSRWLAYAIGVSEAEREKAEKSKEPVKNKLGLRDLVSGESATIDAVQGATFSRDGKSLAMRRYPAKGREGDGADLIVRDLATGLDTTFGNVAAFAFSDDGKLLAMTIDADGKVGNGVQLFEPASGRLRTLESSAAKYSAPTWRKDAADLAVFRENDHAKDEDASFVAIAWRGLDKEGARKSSYDFAKDEGFPKDHRVVDFAGLKWSDDGRVVFLGIKAWENRPRPKGTKGESKPAESKKPTKAAAKKSLRETLKEPAGVEVWHAKDIDIMPLQKKTATRKKRENFLAAWWVEDGRLVQLGNDLTEDVQLVESQRHALGLDNTPYEAAKKFGPTLHDVYLIDVKTGDRKKVLDRLKYALGSSPDGRYVLYLRDGNLWTYDIQGGTHADLTGALGVPFVNRELSTLTAEKPPYGIAGWTKDGKHLLAYDRFDVWDLAPDGEAARRLTDGRKDEVVHRLVRLDFGDDDDRWVRLDRPLYVSLYGETSKKSGFARLRPGEKPETLLWKARGVGRLARAKDAEVYAFVEQDYDDSPDLFVAGPGLEGPRQASTTNPFHKDFLWGRSELVDYTSDAGEKLQGSLIYPAGFEPGKSYPMIVYIYEKLSQSLHSYSAPSERSPYNPAVFSAEGYFVLMPDIVYRPQNPGLSAVECIVPAVKKVLAGGKVDPKRVGLVGHSWGAYQTAFVVTQTDVFAAGAAGAPLTNMMSMSVSVYWNSGQTNAWIFHESQGRMNRPFWRDLDTYIKNSPVFQIDQLKAPLLVTFGDEDGAVDWNQGVELYNAARLAGKPVVMLVYPGENHGLAKKPNQVDYHYRLLDWFGHHLQGRPAPRWIAEGQSHLDRQKEIDALKKARGAESKASEEK